MGIIKIDGCNICGGSVQHIHTVPFKDLIGLGDWNQEIVFCPTCGFIFVANPFDGESLANRYKNLSKYEFDANDYSLGEDKVYMDRSLRQFHFIEENCEIKSILDIGAASGYNLSLYKKKGDVTYGIEPSLANCILAKNKYCVDMFNGLFDEYLTNTSLIRYDLIFLSHTLEHLVNPSDFIKSCRKIDHKYVFIEVPSFDYKFENEPYGMFCEEHVNYFTFEGLNSLMTKNGYVLQEAEMPFSIHANLSAGMPSLATLWKLDEHSKSLKLNPINRTLNTLQDYIAKSILIEEKVKKIIDIIPDDSKVAIWGTGNHTSKLLASTSLLSKNIVKFYDSDKKKYHYTICGKKIQQFDYHDIMIGDVDTILISSFTAQNAILNNLLPYKNSVNIITLY